MKTALARLRAKTDQELSILVARQLQRSLALSHRTNYHDVVRVYELCRALLAVAELPPARRSDLERLLDQLRARVEQPAAAVA